MRVRVRKRVRLRASDNIPCVGHLDSFGSPSTSHTSVFQWRRTIYTILYKAPTSLQTWLPNQSLKTLEVQEYINCCMWVMWQHSHYKNGPTIRTLGILWRSSTLWFAQGRFSLELRNFQTWDCSRLKRKRGCWGKSCLAHK